MAFWSRSNRSTTGRKAGTGLGGLVGGAVGRKIGAIGIAAMGTAIGIPAAVVTGTAAVGGAAEGYKVGKKIDESK